MSHFINLQNIFTRYYLFLDNIKTILQNKAQIRSSNGTNLQNSAKKINTHLSKSDIQYIYFNN